MWHRCDRSAAIVVVSFFFHVSDVALSLEASPCCLLWFEILVRTPLVYC